MKNRIITLSNFMLTSVALLSLVSPDIVYAHGGQIETGGGSGGPVTLSKVQQESIGLQTDKADFRSIDTVLPLNGSVKIDPDRHVHITTRISGRVEKLFAS